MLNYKQIPLDFQKPEVGADQKRKPKLGLFMPVLIKKTSSNLEEHQQQVFHLPVLSLVLYPGLLLVLPLLLLLLLLFPFLSFPLLGVVCKRTSW